MKRTLTAVLSLLFIASVAVAREPGAARHYIITTAHLLTAEEQGQLADDGVDVQHVLPGGRYLVRAAAFDSLETPNISRIEAYDASHKLTPLARRMATSTRAFVTVDVRFHDDAGVDDARAAVEALGGSIDTLLPLDAQRLQVRIPPSKLGALAADERVFGVYGPPLKAKAYNSVAADLSHVTPLFSAPYGLDGTGVVLSLHEPSGKPFAHQEFGSRLTSHADSTAKVELHPTHVSGTMIAQGIDPLAKGMAPNATLHFWDLGGDDGASIAQKGTDLPPLNITGNNNSWGFQLGMQPDENGYYVWYGVLEYYGAYDGFYSAPYDKVALNSAPNVLFVHSSGNDASNGLARNPPFPHKHVDDNFDVVTDETFCYSPSGSGNDCSLLSGCSTGVSTKVHDDNGNPAPHCEQAHPSYGPFNTMSFIASEKNVIAVGAVKSNRTIAGFSSRGPTLDGRVKPDLVAMGVGQYSTAPSNGYENDDGTSMSSPVVTGMSALLVQQWRQTFGGQTPSAQMVKTLLIAGADDIGNPGPDYTFGFGLANAQASVDLIRADNNTGARIRTLPITNGQVIDVPFTVSTAGPLRVVAGWADPPVVLTPDDFANQTLVNDIDLKVVGPSGSTTLPYVLDKNNPDSNATRGANHVDNTEEVEIGSAQPGVYHAILTGTNIAVTPQSVILVANAALGITTPPCGDVYEPNDTPATAFNYVLSQQRVTARICSAQDVDYFNMQVQSAGTITVSITATDTPIRVTLTGGTVNSSVTVAAGQTQTISAFATVGTYTIKVEPAGTVGSDAHYVFTPNFGVTLPPHTRRAGR
jgi:hypothetical protein